MERKIRVGAVSYLNTRPLVYGLEHGLMQDEVDLTYDYPSRVAKRLLNGDIDVGLVPVAIIPELSKFEIITDYCIGAEGAVASVCLFSDVPINEVKKVVLDYESKTSVALTRILLKEHWALEVEFVDGNENFRDHIKGNTAGLVIGDRAFQQRKVSRYIYDLGTAWKELTNLPFVFAVWISTRKLPAEFIMRFNSANKYGLSRMDQILEENHSPLFDLKEYYTERVSYTLDQKKKEGLQLFLSKLGNQK